jgi:hypothetical protein
MFIRFDHYSIGSLNMIRGSGLAQNCCRAPSGLSDVRSSVNAQNHSGTFTVIIYLTKFCETMRSFLCRIVNAIRSCFRSRPNSQALLQDRIEQGNRIIRAHFNDEVFNEADPAHSVVVVVLKYGNQILMPFGRLSEGREQIKEGAMYQLRQLLNHDGNRNCENGRLEIDTLVFQKRMDGRYTYSKQENGIDFSSGDNDHYAFANGIGPDQLARVLNIVIPLDRYPAAQSNVEAISGLILRSL